MNKVNFVIMLVVSIVGCSSAGDTYLDSNKNGGAVSYELRDLNGSCQFVDSVLNKIYVLDIPWPCNIHVDRSGRDRVFREGERDYYLVESSTNHPDLPDDCITYLQGIFYENESVFVSKAFDKVASCPPFQWDEKVFTGLH